MLTRVYDEALRPIGLQASQLPVLVAAALFGETPPTLGALADRLVMERTTLSRNLRPLEKAGLLRIALSPDDGRTRVIVLTRAGERMLEAAYPLWEAAFGRARAAFGAGRMEALRDDLAEVVELAPRLEGGSPTKRNGKSRRKEQA
jgi:DNA-binding MarR family transcriptional regulator